jgi:hypothetical protein
MTSRPGLNTDNFKKFEENEYKEYWDPNWYSDIFVFSKTHNTTSQNLIMLNEEEKIVNYYTRNTESYSLDNFEKKKLDEYEEFIIDLSK